MISASAAIIVTSGVLKQQQLLYVPIKSSLSPLIELIECSPANKHIGELLLFLVSCCVDRTLLSFEWRMVCVAAGRQQTESQVQGLGNRLRNASGSFCNV